ncbi:hypothetical protein M0R45_030608 [Rubus argutus]|uniref:FAD-binding PCMH-type domain-containing protein n=1 Tax=Rubus argutus TaxID=59490 RepID=A0AAW1WDM5_RUBAR
MDSPHTPSTNRTTLSTSNFSSFIHGLCTRYNQPLLQPLLTLAIYTHFLPSAVLYPKSVSDISSTIKLIYEMGSGSELTVAARGHGHSLQGQAQAHQGIVINMESLKGSPEMQVHTGEQLYVDVSGGELWINILHETLKHGLAPKSWTDYLHLTVGGTLSNAGISVQAFRHGPQINNVYQLEVVTGKET